MARTHETSRANPILFPPTLQTALIGKLHGTAPLKEARDLQCIKTPNVIIKSYSMYRNLLPTCSITSNLGSFQHSVIIC